MQSEKRMIELLHQYPGLSRHQYGTLKFIHNNRPTLQYLRVAHAGTLSSLGLREFIECIGSADDEKATVVLTRTGQAALQIYNDSSLNERSHEMELTPRTLQLLRHVRRVTQMRKAG